MIITLYPVIIIRVVYSSVRVPVTGINEAGIGGYVAVQAGPVDRFRCIINASIVSGLA